MSKHKTNAPAALPEPERERELAPADAPAPEEAAPATPPADDDEVVVISVKRKTKKIKLEFDEDQGGTQEFTLKEFAGPDRDAWYNFLNKRTKMSPDGKSGSLTDATDLHPTLISKSLRDASGAAVAISVIRTWSSTAQQTLFDMTKKLNGLDDKAEEEAKKA